MGWLGLFDYLVQRDGISRFFLGWISIRLYRQSDVLSFNSVNSLILQILIQTKKV